MQEKEVENNFYIYNIYTFMTIEEKINFLKECAEFYTNIWETFTTAKSIAIYSALRVLWNLDNEDWDDYARWVADWVVVYMMKLNDDEWEYEWKDEEYFEGWCWLVKGVFEWDEKIIEWQKELMM